jgi:hypothetical protein
MTNKKKLEVEGFEYILNSKDRVIGLILENEANYTMTLRSGIIPENLNCNIMIEW